MVQAYTYDNEPVAVPTKKSRELSADHEEASNIMTDKRVVRGNTYAAKVMTRSELDSSKTSRSSKRGSAGKFDNRRRSGGQPQGGFTPAGNGKEYVDSYLQTDDYLEELEDRPEESDVCTQTDPMLDRPPSPLFVPAKTGIDKDTQIDVDELFNFDDEVQPILEVLVGKTLELSMIECMEEEELKELNRKQQEFEDMRSAEIAEIQRLEAAAKRKFAEKQRRLSQERERKKKQEELKEKVAALNFTRNYCKTMDSEVLQELEEEGYFKDPLYEEVMKEYLPFVIEKVVTEVDELMTYRDLLDSTLEEVHAACQTRFAWSPPPPMPSSWSSSSSSPSCPPSPSPSPSSS